MTNSLIFSKFEELQNKGYTLDIIYLLELFKENIDIDILTKSVRIKNLLQTIERKGLITQNHDITLEGQDLLDFINISEEGTKLSKKKVDNEFEIFWKIFPSTDTFEYKGIKFNGSRALRINKEDCKVKLKAILNSGEYNIDQIIEAIEYDTISKKEMSIKTRTNKLSYMQNSLTYLRQLSFEPFIELIRAGNKIVEVQNNIFDGINL